MNKSETKTGRSGGQEGGVALARPEKDAAAERACLACGQPFESEGWHNRLCPQCRKRS